MKFEWKFCKVSWGISLWYLLTCIHNINNLSQTFGWDASWPAVQSIHPTSPVQQKHWMNNYYWHTLNDACFPIQENQMLLKVCVQCVTMLGVIIWCWQDNRSGFWAGCLSCWLSYWKHSMSSQPLVPQSNFSQFKHCWKH